MKGVAVAANLACLCLAGQACAQADRVVLSGLFPIGSDFCFGRTYDAAHLARNPKQLVTAISIGGRNAQRSAPSPAPAGSSEATTSGNVYVALTVRFRDRAKAQSWPGSCVGEDAGHVHCKVFPPRNQDSHQQGLTLRAAGTGYTIEADGDWKLFRRAADDGSTSKDVAPDDRLFRVARLPVGECGLSVRDWSAAGATPAFLGQLP